MQWQRYVTCVNKPFGDRPAQLREYLAKWQCDVKESVRLYFNWELNIDERTVLDQSPFRTDLTEQWLRKNQLNITPPFYDKIKEALVVIY